MCVTPITINRNTPDQMTVGCGRCMPCHLKYTNQWALRVQLHANQCLTHYCVTLTYDGHHLPYTKITPGKRKGVQSYMTLQRSHAQLFFKTLRNKQNKRYKGLPKVPPISYIICGEYGDKTHRPHYHAVIFNAHADDILESWKHGNIFFGGNNVNACTKYALKYALKSRLWTIHGKGLYERPFINVSKGIGSCLIERGHKTWKYYTEPYPVKGRKKVYHEVDITTGEYRTWTIQCYNNIRTHKITCYDTYVPTEFYLEKTKMLLPRYYTKKAGIEVPTEKYRELSLEKYREMESVLREQNLTYAQWAKMYQKWLWSLKRENLYDNRIWADMPLGNLVPYVKEKSLKFKNQNT